VVLSGAVPGGVLVGVQAFEWSAMIGNSWTAVRLMLGVVLVLMGLGAVGALSAHMLGILVSVILSFVICGSLLGKGLPKPERPPGIYVYMRGYLLTFGAYGVLSSADVLLVKSYFPPEQAGIFAMAATVARMVFFLPGPVAAAMFPKVTSAGESSAASRRTLLKAIIVSGLMVAGIGVVFLVIPEFMLKLLTREVHPGQVTILRCMVLALAPLTLVQLFINYELAQRRFGIMLPLYVCAGGYVLGTRFWHETPLQVVLSLGVASTIALIFCTILVWWQSRQKGSREVSRA
jgi:O-antigen/teichoic acid export membrane protein